MIVASAYMSPTVHAVDADAELPEVDRLLQAHEVSALVVEDRAGEPLGVISRSDLLRVAVAAPGLHALELPALPARQAMTESVVCVEPETPLAHVARQLAERGIHRVFVRQGGVLVGVVSVLDVMRAVAVQRVSIPIAEVMSPKVVSIAADETMAVAAERIAEAHEHGLVVMENEWPVGIVTAAEILLAQHWPAYTAVEEWMVPRVLCLPAGMALFRAAAHALAMSVRHVLVMHDDGLAGIVTPIDVARAFARS